MLSGIVDWDVWESNQDAFPPPESITIGTTNCCQIMPGPTNNSDAVENPDLKVRTAVETSFSVRRHSLLQVECGVWTILERFGYDDIRMELGGSTARWLGNILTLRSELRDMFDHLRLWFEAVPSKVCSSSTFYFLFVH